MVARVSASEVAVARTCRNLERATVFRAAPWKRTAVLAVAAALYAAVLPYVWNTMGEPRRRAVLEAEALSAKKMQSEVESLIESDGEVEISWGEDDDMETDMVSDVDDDVSLEDVEETERNGTSDNEDDEEDERPLPSPYLPDAGAAAALFCLMTGTVLFNLLCRWFVWFRALIYFEQADKVVEGYYVHVLPYAYRGKPELVEVRTDRKTGNLYFEFQRQKFELVENLPVDQVKLMGLSEANERVDSDDEELVVQKMTALEKKECEDWTRDAISRMGAFVPVICRVDEPVKSYYQRRGLRSKNEIEDQKDRFGVNSLQVEMKTMPDLVKEQLLSPLAMFQFFSAALWLMDEYWQYTIFNLFTIVMMEAATAFQRHRTLKTLKGLAPKPYELPAHREGRWISVKTTDLLPGDLVSLSSSSHSVAIDLSKATEEQAVAAKAAAKAQAAARKHGTDAVPCDCLILHGSAVVNEATLTGESVPQMKDALKSTTHSDPGAPLDINGRDRVHTLFSGTTIISSSPGEPCSKSFPTPPDNGCLCIVLRTGFGSSQGELMQMIEFSTESVSSDSKETGMALLVLLCFAIISAGYVFHEGMKKGDRTTHELLLKCVIILTSVVPRQLPIQMALAVNHALVTLMREGIFCTEPYRVPYSGKITHCLFDKTGTLTTDELVPVGVVNVKGDTAKNLKPGADAKSILVGVKDASENAAMVLAACHSLVGMPSGISDANAPVELLGDPIELAAVKGVRWSFVPKSQLATPGDMTVLRLAIAKVRAKAKEALKTVMPENASSISNADVDGVLARLENQQQGALTGANKQQTSTLKEYRKQLLVLEQKLKESTADAARSKFKSIKILERFHFSSKLQRMSVLCQAKLKSGDASELFALVKGSPEAISKLLRKDAQPKWYEDAYRTMAEQGMRVLALAYKKLNVSDADLKSISRDEAENYLEFAGFIAFECKTRGDSGIVIRSLCEADHRVAMLTGDAPLTALHVAKITNICGDPQRRENPPLLLTEKKDGTVEWVGAIGPVTDQVRIQFQVTEMPTLAEKHDLLTTEAALLAAVHLSQGQVWRYVDRIQVFARMSPQGKAKVIRMIQQFQDTDKNIETESFVPSKQKNFVLMCGDGGNDVGALKQADVGLALLSGYGNANTDDSEATGEDDVGASEDALNKKANEMKILMKAAEKKKQAEMALFKKEIQAKQKQMLDEELAKFAQRGETGFMVQFNAIKIVAQRMQAEIRRENDRLNRKYNINLAKSQKETLEDKDPSELALEAMEDPNALPVVRPGDASVAAPFTARIPSIRSAIQLIRQGRCTLLSALQQQQIMMLECTISAYCLAALSLEGARSSERQMMASSWLIMTASLAFSYSTPVEKMHPVRPIRSLFHPAIFISILGQAAIHLFAMVTAVRLAKEAMGEEKLQEVVRFNRRVSRGLEKKLEEETDTLDAMAEVFMLWSQPFMPNLMNTVIFLVETSQIMAVLFVNYKGRPWMLGLLENHALFLSLFLCIGGLSFAAFEVSPSLNRLIHLESFPDDEFRFKIIGLVFITLFGTFIWDRLVTAIFARDVFRAMVEQAKETTVADVMPIFYTLVKVAAGFALLATGNPLIWAGAYWAYRRWKTRQEQAEFAKLQN